MARGRLISKSLGSSRKFYALIAFGGRLGEFCQVLFPLIVANTDDYGRMPGDAFTVKHVVLPSSRRPEAEFEQALHLLAEVHLIDRYVVDGTVYLQVEQFDAHQINLHKRSNARFPENPAPGSGLSGTWDRTFQHLGPENPAPESGNPVLREPRTQNPEENPEPRTQIRQVSKEHSLGAGSPKKPATDPRVREFLQWFQTEYQKVRGAPYLVHWEKHGAMMKRMLGATDLAHLKIYAQILLSEHTDDDFIVQTDRGIEILQSRFSWLADRYAIWQRKQARS